MMTRVQIEDALRARVEQARVEYERLKAESDPRKDTLGTPDGTLPVRRAEEALDGAKEARQNYDMVLKAFSDFIFRGKLPADFKLTDRS